MLADSTLDAVGDTPLVDLSEFGPSGGARTLVKWEGANPTGSMKDRMALAMVRGAERAGELAPDQRVVEYTGGSTGSSLAFVCAATDRPATMVTADCFAEEKIRTMRALGADVIVHETPEGRIYPGFVDDLMEYVDEVVEGTGAYHTDQFVNPHHTEGYAEMGREILADCPDVTDFVMSYGTGGCLVGNGRVLEPEGVRLTAVEPAESPLLTEDRTGSHSVEGVAVGRPPTGLDELEYDPLAVPEAEARETARRLATETGLFAGTSSGLNVAAAVRVAAERDPDDVVVTVACDTGLKYLAGGLFAPGGPPE